jgi:hypothetical protein
LVDPQNPLTARVTVNRYWQMIFGSGLVQTVEDFGAQGERPSHPELLDWLAVEFADGRWDVKQFLRQVVGSAAYQQSSHVTDELAARDPENRLLARGPRHRLPAETVRDAALFASGLLVERSGGPSVKPYQPEGLWKEIATDMEYDQSHGADLYRRSLYTYWKRTVAPPSMVAFDGATREFCTAKRSRTNTPLQALALMNETTYVEAARLLAERAMREAGESADARLTRMFRLVLGRAPAAEELRVLSSALAFHRERFAADTQAAAAVLKVGEHPADASLPSSELAAYAAVAGMVLNLDEAVVKE